jgi:ferritin-like metal-binding protein YciE
MTGAEDRLIQWLRDAHAMEEHAVTMLSTLAGRLDGYPEFKTQVERHLKETERQVERLNACIDRRNGGSSAIKDTIAKMAAFAQGASGIAVGDEPVKGALALYTFEHMEVASYQILIAAAEEVGDMETKRVCEEILQEEAAMGQWLGDALQSLTHSYLAREEREERASS